MQTAVPIISDRELMQLRRQHPETDGLLFGRAVASLARKRVDWDHVSDEMGNDYAKKHIGERP